MVVVDCMGCHRKLCSQFVKGPKTDTFFTDFFSKMVVLERARL